MDEPGTNHDASRVQLVHTAALQHRVRRPVQRIGTSKGIATPRQVAAAGDYASPRHTRRLVPGTDSTSSRSPEPVHIEGEDFS